MLMDDWIQMYQYGIHTMPRYIYLEMKKAIPDWFLMELDRMVDNECNLSLM